MSEQPIPGHEGPTKAPAPPGLDEPAPVLAGTVGRPRSLAGLSLFLGSALATAGGIVFGLVLFPSEAGLVGVFLVAFASEPTVGALLARNRDQIWEQGVRPAVANRGLAVSLLLIFGGVLVVYVAAVQLLPVARLETLFDSQLGAYARASLADVNFGTVHSLLVHNLGVAATCLLFAVFYRSAGLLFVLAWNASRWGVVISYMARAGGDVHGAMRNLAATSACVLPHLALEAVAYVVVAMAGVFLSRGVAKYEAASEPFWRVIRAATGLVLVGVLILALAALFEAELAPLLVVSFSG